jgi:hypothetical protein
MSETPDATPSMLVQALESYAIEVAMTLAGLQEQDPSVEPLDPQQLVVAVYAAVSAYARTRSDYDESVDVTGVLQLAVAAYAQALYAAASEVFENIEADPDALGELEEIIEGETLQYDEGNDGSS